MGRVRRRQLEGEARAVMRSPGAGLVGSGRPAGSRATADCSAHWFDYRDGLVAEAFYSQGVRILDTSDPFHIKQVGWYVPRQGMAWAAYWDGPYLFVADFVRGIDVLRFSGKAGPHNRDLAGPSVPADPIVTALRSPVWGYVSSAA
jgi:hypothetical protein